MHIERLEVLSKFLKNLPKSRFEIRSWFDGVPDGGLHLEDLDCKHECGTSACAVGWACTIPELISQGLSFKGRDGGTIEAEPSFMGLFGWDAVELFFDIDINTASWLFSGYSYDDSQVVLPKDVYERIDDLILAYKLEVKLDV